MKARRATESIQAKDARLVQITDAAFAYAATRAGGHLLCRPGCTQCCQGAFAISALDALRLRDGMADLAQTEPERAAAIAERARDYLTEFRSSFPGDPITGILGTSDAEQAAFEEFANDAPCPALHPQSGLCELYSARPMLCRTFGPPVRVTHKDADEQDDAAEGFAVCELCFTTAAPAEIAAAEMNVPYAQEQSVLEAMHLPDPSAETIIACCLVTLPAQPAPVEPS